jgi:Cd2+/Zn2+-exporting ATPase
MLGGSKAKSMVFSTVLILVSFVLKEAAAAETQAAEALAAGAAIAMLATAAVAGFPIFKKAFGALRYKIVGIDALVTIAVIGAIAIGEYWEAAAVTYLFSLGDYLESRTIEKTRSSIKALLDLAPDTVRVRRGAEEVEISPQDVLVGDVAVVRPGEKIGVDGRVLEGSGYVNQATISGESLPVLRTLGGEVFSGTILESGYLLIEAKKVGEDTTFARILHMVEEAQERKAKTQKFLESFSRWYTPAIVAASALLFVATRDIELALTLLVIACPGALVISAPVAIVAGIGNGSKRGFLVKGGDIMEKLGSIKAIAFDKTGTLTVGAPEVRLVRSFAGAEAEVLSVAAAGEGYSEHPLARAILAHAKAQGLGPEPAAVRIIPGRGVAFDFGGKECLAGSRSLLAESGIALSGEQENDVAREESKGRTVVLVASGGIVLGFIAIADAARPEAAAEILALRRLGIRRIVMLTGDNPRAAQAIAEELGIDEVRSGLLPQGKVEALESLKQAYGRVAMVGDGVNDAPALAAADLGIAMGGVGSDVAMETADVVLVSADLSRLSYGLGLSRATVRVMKQNIYFALGVAGLLLAGVLVKAVNLSFGMLVHEASVLLVILNAVRLLKYGRGSTFKPRR